MGPPRRVALTTADGVELAARYWAARDAPTRDAPTRDAPTPDAPTPEAPTREAPTRELGCVLAHGFTGSTASPRLQAIGRLLQTRGLGVLAPDLRGHGRSGGLSTIGDAEVHDVAAAVAWLRTQGYERVAVLGWSMGASIVLRYAGLGGDADAVVSISSPGPWFERGTRPMRAVHWLCETGRGRLTARLALRTRVDPSGWTEVPAAPVDVVGRIAPTPLLIVHGYADAYFPVGHARLLAAAAPSADVWIEAAMGHAETGTTPALMLRILGWLQAHIATAEVCNDGRHD